MTDNEGCRLDSACKCLDLEKPSKDEWLRIGEEECRSMSLVFRSLSDPIRIKILDMLTKDSLYVCIIQHLLDGIMYSKLSYHLDILKKARLIDSVREGNFVLYSLTEKGRLVSDKFLLSG